MTKSCNSFSIGIKKNHKQSDEAQIETKNIDKKRCCDKKQTANNGE